MEEKKAKTSHEENVISPAEFEELEKKEEKRIRLKKSLKREPIPKPTRREKATDVEMLILKTEKLDGKIEAMADYRKAVDERLSGLNQEIGELRSSVMERDRVIRDVQKGFSKIEEMAEGMEPEKITRQLTKKDESIEKNQAAIEALAAQIKQLRKDTKANSSILEGVREIKNIENIVQMLNQKMGKIDDDRKFTSRTAGKIEAMFSDVSDKLGEFQSYKDKIAFNEETMHEIMKVVDMLETRFDETTKKDDLKKLEGSVEEGFEKVRTEGDDKLYELKKLMDNLLTALKESGMRGVLESVGKSRLDKMFATKDDLEEIGAKLDMLREATAQTVREKQIELAGERPTPDTKVSIPAVGRQQTPRVSRPAREIPQAPVPEKPKPREGPEKAPPKKEPVKKSRGRIPPAPVRKEAPPSKEPVKGPWKRIPPTPARGEAMPQPGPEEKPPSSRISPILAVEDSMDSLMEQIEEAIKRGNLEIAKKLYRETLSLYDQLNEAENYQDVTVLYDRIKRLYSRLRIYT